MHPPQTCAQEHWHTHRWVHTHTPVTGMPCTDVELGAERKKEREPLGEMTGAARWKIAVSNHDMRKDAKRAPALRTITCGGS